MFIFNPVAFEFKIPTYTQAPACGYTQTYELQQKDITPANTGWTGVTDFTAIDWFEFDTLAPIQDRTKVSYKAIKPTHIDLDLCTLPPYSYLPSSGKCTHPDQTFY